MDINNYILDAVAEGIESGIKNAPYAQAVKGVVESKIDENYYNVKINGKQYKVFNPNKSSVFTEMDLVFVTVPNNDWSNLFICNIGSIIGTGGGASEEWVNAQLSNYYNKSQTDNKITPISSIANEANATAKSASAAASSATTLATDAVNKANQSTNLANEAMGKSATVYSVANESMSLASSIAKTAQDAFAMAEKAKALAESVAFVYDPTNGELLPLQVVLNNIFYMMSSQITAQEFDNIDLIASAFDAYEMAAIDFDTRAKSILIGV